MALLYATTLAQARLQAALDAVGAAGLLVLGTSALNGGAPGTLATFTLGSPAFGTIAGRIITFGAMPMSAVASAAGVAAKAEIRTAGGILKVSGLTVGISGSSSSIIVDTTAIVNTRTVFVLSGTITHP